MLVLSTTGSHRKVGANLCLNFHLFPCPIVCFFSGVLISTNSTNVDLDSTSARYPKFSIYYILLLSIMLCLFVPLVLKYNLGRTSSCIFNHFLSWSLFCLPEGFQFLPILKLVIWITLLFFIPFFLSCIIIIFHNVGYVYHLYSRKALAEPLQIFPIIFLSYSLSCCPEIFQFLPSLKMLIWTAPLPVIPSFMFPEFLCCP